MNSQSEQTNQERIGKQIGPATYESSDIAYKLRPLPITNNDNSIFIDCARQDLSTTAIEIYEKESEHIDAIDFHFGRKFLEIGVSTPEKKEEYIKKGICTTSYLWPCRASIKTKPTITWLHVDKVKLCNENHSSEALQQAFSKIGTVVKIAPKQWEGIPIPSRSCLVVMEVIKGKIPETLIVDGAPVTIETTGGSYVCRECFSVEHKPECPKNWQKVQASKSRQNGDSDKQPNTQEENTKQSKKKKKQNNKQATKNAEDKNSSNNKQSEESKSADKQPRSQESSQPSQDQSDSTHGNGQVSSKHNNSQTPKHLKAEPSQTKHPVQRLQNEVRRRTSAPDIRKL